MSRSWHPLLWLIVIAELSPASHALRLAALAWSQVAVGGIAAGAITYGAVTFVIEAGAACAAAVLVTSEPSDRWGLAHRGRTRIDRWMTDRRPFHPVAVPGVAIMGGSAVTVWARHVGQVRPTRAQHLRFGLAIAAGLGAFGAIQGGLVGLGVSISAPLLLAFAVASFGVALLIRLATDRRMSASIAAAARAPAADPVGPAQPAPAARAGCGPTGR